jgi:hypothetical protein
MGNAVTTNIAAMAMIPSLVRMVALKPGCAGNEHL